MDGSSPKRIKAAVADGFPDDPLTEILSRLPAKPLFRFKCVSKDWCHLITDRLGRGRFPQTLEGFFVTVDRGVKDGRFIDLSGKSVPLVDASFSFLTKLPGMEHIDLLSGHNGLLLFGHFRDRWTYEYIVCNPATEQWRRVPSSGLTPSWPRKLVDVELGNEDDIPTDVHNFLIFDPAVSSHFHLLQTWHSSDYGHAVQVVRVFSSETGDWIDKSAEWTEWGPTLIHDKVQPKLGWANLNGMLHVPVYQLHYWTGKKDILIAVVDMQGKKSLATYRHWPDMNEFTAGAFIGQSQGLLHCITGHKKQEGQSAHITGLSIWVLEDYDAAQCVFKDYDAGQWVLKKSVKCSKLFGEMSCGVDDLDVIAIHPDRNLVFFLHRYNWKLMSYDMDSEEACDLCTPGDGCGQIVPYVPYFGDVPVLRGGPPTEFLEGESTGLFVD